MRRPKGFSIGAPWVFRVARQSGRDSGKAEWRRQWQDRQTVSVCCVRRGEKISFQYSLGLFCFCFRLCFCFGGLFWIEIQSAKIAPLSSLGPINQAAPPELRACGRVRPRVWQRRPQLAPRAADASSWAARASPSLGRRRGGTSGLRAAVSRAPTSDRGTK